MYAETGEGFKAYIRIDIDLEHIMRWEAEGVTVRSVNNEVGYLGTVSVQVNVEMSSPSCRNVSKPPQFKFLGPNTYTFNPGKLPSRVEIRQQGIFSKSRSKDAAALIERNAAAGIDWLYRMLCLEGRLVWGFACHSAEA